MSKKKKGKWVWQAGATPPPLDAHSRIKHLVIKDYLSRYIQVLMTNPLRPRLPLTLVDGFAGGGIYRNEEGGDAPGSPLLLLQTVSNSESNLNSGRHTTQRQIDATYHFVEPSTPNFHCLNHTLREAGYGAAIGNRVHLHHTEFEAVADHIIGSIAARSGERALFLLDQYNYSDVDLRLVRRILTSLRGSEVILTFNVGSLISFLSDTPRARKTAARIGLEQFIHWPSISMLKASGRYREGIQRQLAHGIHQASGAKFMTLFFVTPQGASPWSYWLVHLSNAYKANDVMKEVHWLHGNSFGHSLEPGLFRLGYQANRDSLVTGQSSLAFDTPAAFDSSLHTSSVNNLREHLCRTLFESTSGCGFDDMVLNLANNTNATAEMIKESLNEPILSGEIIVITEGGGRRRKGGSITPGDQLQFKQSPLLFT
ncbi:three-Cys-motif partner protein TcmP [Achromobacter kerstersii]|uniref:three-Cys-motif partner protein TcmP n=1 Tax=Achromobacter kerstersii TaxID=1353890 RepID=UPI003D03D2E0